MILPVLLYICIGGCGDYNLTGQPKIMICLDCVCIYLFFVPVSLTTHEWRWRNSGWGICKNNSDSNWQFILLPLPLLYLSSPSSCLIILVCVFLWACISVWRSVCSCAHCANVCVALILVFPLTTPLPPFLSSPLMVTNPPLNFTPNLIYSSFPHYF